MSLSLYFRSGMYALCFKTHGSINHSKFVGDLNLEESKFSARRFTLPAKKTPFCEGYYKTVAELLLCFCDVGPDLLQLSRLSPDGNNTAILFTHSYQD